MDLTPIGYIQCPQRYRFEAARQASIAPDNRAWIQLEPDPNLQQGLLGLDDFERIWVVYRLHLNQTWHPLVQPPQRRAGKLGVFATRSPHRPNSIGMSCVRLLTIDGNRLEVAQHDFLDGTPVLDIKPYLPYADAFPQASAGWVDQHPERVYTLHIPPAQQTKLTWIADRAGWDLVNFLQVQLRTDPTNIRRKRITPLPHAFRIAFRTWRIDYQVDREAQRIDVAAVGSGYAPTDLAADTPDRYQDKETHRQFIAAFGPLH
ncbi:MAG: tRNA (N6-threonylcarbamoyladenosine(37)-N6)-methyltransferase TrmO [Candidatus Latescibacteria bacterium]|nr:tRNA (N6-threonylcarbamoyladenosine(37)-N6)-methyltransferase TrmO [Candidatus Latescibacterota bacterium]